MVTLTVLYFFILLSITWIMFINGNIILHFDLVFVIINFLNSTLCKKFNISKKFLFFLEIKLLKFIKYQLRLRIQTR